MTGPSGPLPAAHVGEAALDVTVPPRPTARFHAVTAGWALVAAIMAASLGRFMLAIVVLLFGVLLGVAWCDGLARVLLHREARGRLTWSAMAGWAVCPLTGLLFAALSFSPWPYALRVKLSEPALLRLVEGVDHGRPYLRNPGRAGLIFVDDVMAKEDCVVLTTEWAFLTEYGLVYSRDGGTPKPFPLHVRHLYGRWYVFSHCPF